MAINFIMLPSLRRVSLPYDRVAAWSRLYDIGSKIMVTLSGVSGLAFGIAAYYAPNHYIQNSMITSALLSLSPLPVTLLAIRPTVQALKAIDKGGDDVKATADGDQLIEKWGKLSLIRWSLVMLGALNGLKELSEWYAL
jgi:hypothetical protein